MTLSIARRTPSRIPVRSTVRDRHSPDDPDVRCDHSQNSASMEYRLLSALRRAIALQSAVLGYFCLILTYLTRQPTRFQAPVQHRAGGLGRNSLISRRISRNRFLGTAIWKVTYRPCRISLAPILTSFSRKVVSDQCSVCSAAPTSAYGYKQTLAGLKTTSASPPGADVPGGVAEGPFLTQAVL